MKIPDVLYHATSEKNWRRIKKQGLIPAFPAVYMTDDLNAAMYFAKLRSQEVEFDGNFIVGKKNVPVAILAIETTHLNKELLGTAHEMLCDILNTTDFWHYYETIPPEYISRLRLKKEFSLSK